MDVVWQVLIGFIPAVLGVLAARAWERMRTMQRYGYLRKLLSGYEKVNIIVSSIEIPRFRFATDVGEVTHTSPRNVLFMPMPEGRAIGTLIGLLQRVRAKARVELITANNYDPSVPTFSIGGPSVNSFPGGPSRRSSHSSPSNTLRQGARASRVLSSRLCRTSATSSYAITASSS